MAKTPSHKGVIEAAGFGLKIFTMMAIGSATATIRKYRPKSRRRPTQGWQTFLRNHAGAIAAMDFFVVPTLTLRLLYVLIVITHERRKVIHFNITEAPTTARTAQQIVNAFPYDTAPRYLLRDRDSIYGSAFVRRVEGMGIQQKLISPHSPWQNPYVERLIGSIRRECLDRVIVFHERHLRQLQSLFRILSQSPAAPVTCSRQSTAATGGGSGRWEDS